MENGGQCFLVFDEGFERAHRHVKMIEEVRALLKGKCLVAWGYAGVGRARGFDVCQNKIVCGSEICLATLDEFSGVRIRLVVVRHSGANRLPRGRGTRGESEVQRRSTNSATLSTRRWGAKAALAASTLDLAPWSSDLGDGCVCWC